ncbi:nodulin homeobox isoform X2 [Asparagus officinalis]|uniref:nodulin homeobox isoform X2 n=1 Tax=Asparagus officinalis TaxID=4686 RepID=UPI00098E1C4B|nr:nodulin homeobox isoform X2 [Asparagus officinalis]
MAREISDQPFDLISIVEHLNGVPSKEITKSLKDAEGFIIQCSNGRGSVRQVDVEKLAASLPLHLIAVLLSSDTGTRLAHLLRGVRLLHVLCDAASRHNRLEQILLDDVKVSEQLLDLVFFMLIVLAQTEQDYGLGTSVPPLHSALVACTFHLLTGYISSQWHELVHVLLAHPKVDIFMDVAFDAVHADIRLLCVKLSGLDKDILCKSSSLRAAETTANFLCQQCEVSLQFLLSLCQQKLFRDRLLKNKELCKTGGIFSLCLTILKLKTPSSFTESLRIVAAVSRLKSKVLSILLQLCEAESVSYLDEVAGSPKSMRLAKSVALQVCFLFNVKVVKQSGKSVDRHPTGLVLLNSLCLADIYSDDSNFRSFFMTNAIQVLIEILGIPHEEFRSRWCSTDIPMEEDINLEYDPFTAAGVALLFLSPDCDSALSAPVPPSENNFGCHSNFNGAMSLLTYAQQKASYLVKIIANLHCFIPNICEEEEKNLFLNKFLECLCMEASESCRYPSNFKEKAATICENLSSLADYTASLIPSLLNDEDVNLLRLFTEQLKKLIPPQVDDNLIKEPDARDVKATIKKIENLHPTNQSLPNWSKLSNPDYIKMDQDAQNTKEGASSTLGRLNISAQEGTQNFKGELDQYIITIKPEDRPDDVELDQNEMKNVLADSSGVAELLRGIEKENRKFETKGEVDMIYHSGEFCKASEYAKGSGLQDDEKVDNIHEKQHRKRKRNIMSERQVNLIEGALVDEPDMQRNSASLQSWADTLSAEGSEITPSQLKNWLNNRKARLARAAREARGPSEGENPYSDKTCGPSTSHFCDSPDSANEDLDIPPSKTGILKPNPNTDFKSQHRVHQSLKPGAMVMVVDEEGKEVGKGKVFQVDGRWQGKNLEDVGVCIVDITDLKVERSKEVQYPSDGGGRTFEEAAGRNGGVARVAWDVIRVHQLLH